VTSDVAWVEHVPGAAGCPGHHGTLVSTTSSLLDGVDAVQARWSGCTDGSGRLEDTLYST